MSILRGPRLQPPGMATRARPKRATSGPMIWMEARILCTRSYGATWDWTAVVSMVMVPWPNSTTAPEILQHLAHGVHVLDIGNVVEHAGARGEQGGGHQLERRVLRSRDRHPSGQAAPAAHQKARLFGIRSHHTSSNGASRRPSGRLSACCELALMQVAPGMDRRCRPRARCPSGSSPVSGEPAPPPSRRAPHRWRLPPRRCRPRLSLY